jgi:hypothetical protein
MDEGGDKPGIDDVTVPVGVVPGTHFACVKYRGPLRDRGLLQPVFRFARFVRSTGQDLGCLHTRKRLNAIFCIGDKREENVLAFLNSLSWS